MTGVTPTDHQVACTAMQTPSMVKPYAIVQRVMKELTALLILMNACWVKLKVCDGNFAITTGLKIFCDIVSYVVAYLSSYHEKAIKAL